MIQEIPYGMYIEKNDLNDLNKSNVSVVLNDSVMLNESNELNDLEKSLPVSVEVIPHKAIHDVYHDQEIRVIRRREREIPNYVKWVAFSIFCIPVLIILSSIRL